MDFDEWAELMAEPPGGHNHGKSRGNGVWVRLDEDTARAFQADLSVEAEDDVYRRPVKPEETIVHGTLAAYNHDECRCSLCRAAMSTYRRLQRRHKSS